ncbi:hypothetical protein RE429_28505 (plasmid) [Microvirga sp. M2]
MKKAALWADDLKAPSAPIVTIPAVGLPQFVNRIPCLGRSHLKIDNLQTRVVWDRFSTVDEVEKAAHQQSFRIRGMDPDW